VAPTTTTQEPTTTTDPPTTTTRAPATTEDENEGTVVDSILETILP
jgi:hypothetical protein